MFRVYLKYCLLSFLFLLPLFLRSQNGGNNGAVTTESITPSSDQFKVSTIKEVKKQFVVDKNTKKRTLKYGDAFEDERESASQTSKLDFNQITDSVSSVQKSPEPSKANLTSAYFNYLKSDVASRDYEQLKQAFVLDNKSQELQFEMVKYYELTTDIAKKKGLLKELNRTLNSSIKEYAHNTLMSVEKNGILVTYGKNDTYPIWVLQELEGVRKDVVVLNYDLLMDDEYRKRVLKEHKLKLNKSYTSTINILTDLAKKNTNKPIYFALTVSHLVLNDLKHNLYATGLAMKYEKNKLNNTPILILNWETKFKTSELFKTTKAGEAKRLEKNYLLPLVQSARYYKQTKETKKYNETKKVAIDIASRNGKKTEVEAIFKNL